MKLGTKPRKVSLGRNHCKSLEELFFPALPSLSSPLRTTKGSVELLWFGNQGQISLCLHTKRVKSLEEEQKRQQVQCARGTAHPRKDSVSSMEKTEVESFSSWSWGAAGCFSPSLSLWGSLACYKHSGGVLGAASVGRWREEWPNLRIPPWFKSFWAVLRMLRFFPCPEWLIKPGHPEYLNDCQIVKKKT